MSDAPKLILDVACGGKMFWFDKKHPNVVFQDKRVIRKGELSFLPHFSVDPDVVGDFRRMQYTDKRFKLVVFDPPFISRKATNKSWIRSKYEILNKETWKDDLKAGFSECFRVLEDYGILVFKWSEIEIPLKDVLELTPIAPLFGSRHGKGLNTIWLVFMKIPKGEPNAK